MSRTESQRLASIANGRKSLGPITPSGRLAASRGSTRHGFTGDGKNLPPDMEAEVRKEIAIDTAKYRPRDDSERELIRRAALGTVRARRLAEAENVLIDERMRTAVKRWDEARADEVAALAAGLDADPETAQRHLRRTADGCDYLGDAWETLGRVLAINGHWDEAHAWRALRLLGIAEEPSPTSPEPLREFWLRVLALRFERDPAPLMKTVFRAFADVNAVRAFLPTPDDARAELQQFVLDRVNEYEALGHELWETYDAPARASSPTRAIFDPSPEALRLHRYFKDAERMRKQALDELAKLRREEDRGRRPAPARNEPEPAESGEPSTAHPTPPGRSEAGFTTETQRVTEDAQGKNPSHFPHANVSVKPR
jgi:hypothetical protein